MREVTDVSIDPTGTVYIVYLDSDDVRLEGVAALRHTLRLEPSEQYAEGVDAVLAAVNALLDDVLEDWRSSDPVPQRPLTAPQPPVEGVPGQMGIDDYLGDDDDDELSPRNWRAIETAQREQ